jgi:hypothetical protein
VRAGPGFGAEPQSYGRDSGYAKETQKSVGRFDGLKAVRHRVLPEELHFLIFLARSVLMFIKKLCLIHVFLVFGSFCFGQEIDGPLDINVAWNQYTEQYEGAETDFGVSGCAAYTRHFIHCYHQTTDVFDTYCPDSQLNNGTYQPFWTDGSGSASFTFAIATAEETLNNCVFISLYEDTNNNGECDQGDDYLDYEDDVDTY